MELIYLLLAALVLFSFFSTVVLLKLSYTIHAELQR